MKKILAALIVLFVAMFLIAPFFIGTAAEKQIDKQIKNISRNSNVDVSNIYKKGWFTSTAETTFDLSQVLNQYTGLNTNISIGLKKIIVKTRSEIIHGPFPLKRLYSKQPVLKPVLSVTKNVTKIIFPPDVMDFTPTIITYISVLPNGNGIGAFTIPKTEYKNIYEGNEIKIGEVNGEMSFSSDLQNHSLKFIAPKIFLKEKKKEIAINNFKFATENEKNKNANFKLSFDNIDIENVKISEGKFNGTTKLKNGLISFSADLNIKKWKSKNEKAGPIEFSLTGKNIKKSAYDQIAKLLKEYKNNSSQDKNNKIANVFLMTQIMALLPELLAESPEIVLEKCNITSSEGKSVISTAFKIDGSKINNANDIKQLIKAIIFDFSMTVPEKIAEKYKSDDENAKMFAVQKMMIKDGDNYKLNVLYKNAKLMINGKPFSFPDKQQNSN